MCNMPLAEIKPEIQKHYLDLLHQLDVVPILDHLFQARVVSFDNYDRICDVSDNRKRREVLRVVMKTDIHDQETFLKILKEHQPRLHETICSSNGDKQVNQTSLRGKDEDTKTKVYASVKRGENGQEEVEEEDEEEEEEDTWHQFLNYRHEEFPEQPSQSTSKENLRQAAGTRQSGTTGYAVRRTMDETRWHTKGSDNVITDPSIQLSGSKQDFNALKPFRPKTSFQRSYPLGGNGEKNTLSKSLTMPTGSEEDSNALKPFKQRQLPNHEPFLERRRRSRISRQLSRTVPKVWSSDERVQSSCDDDDLKETNKKLLTQQEELMKQNKTFCDELIDQDRQLDDLRHANTMLLVKNKEFSSQLQELRRNVDSKERRRDKVSNSGKMPGQVTYDLDCDGLVQGLFVCPSLIFDGEKANTAHCHLNGISQMTSKLSNPDTFSKFYGTCTTYPLSVEAPQYWESNIEISPIGQVQNECLFVDISITWESERDLNYNNAATTHSWRLCAVFCPLHHRICVWLWHKQHIKCYAVAKAVPHAPSYTLSYGFLFHAEKRRLTILDLKDTTPTVVHEMNKINVNEKLWPMYGIFNEKWAKSKVRLQSGDSIVMTPDKKKMINRVLERP